MERLLEFMDFLIKHLGGVPRRYPTGFPVHTIGSLPRKTSRIRTTFQTYNFSFILRGCGEYRFGGTTFPVQAPCVLTQWPGAPMDYGPDERTWDELYLVYEAASGPALRAARFVQDGRPLWPVRDSLRLHAAYEELLEALAQRDSPADRVDRLCERLIFESLAGSDTQETDKTTRAIDQIRATVRARPGLAHDFDALARRGGFSVPTFRRHWRRIVGTAPATWLRGLRLREACRLLVETRLSIAEIARQIGFDDELYFSRRFHREIGMTASAYRRAYAPRER